MRSSTPARVNREVGEASTLSRGSLSRATSPAARRPLFTDAQRWRYALPDAVLDAGARREAEAGGLFFVGDGCVGQGRVHRAVADGADAAGRVAAYLAEAGARHG